MSVTTKSLQDSFVGPYPLRLYQATYELLKKNEEIVKSAATRLGETKPKRKDVLNYMFKKSPDIKGEVFFKKHSKVVDTNSLHYQTTFHITDANKVRLRTLVESIENTAIQRESKIPSVMLIYNVLLLKGGEINPDEYFNVQKK